MFGSMQGVAALNEKLHLRLKRVHELACRSAMNEDNPRAIWLDPDRPWR